MSKNSSCITSKNNKGFTVMPINEDQFLVESNYKTIKIVGENEYSLTYIDIEDGPIFHIGKDFLGMGNIVALEIIDTEEENYIIIKVTTDAI